MIFIGVFILEIVVAIVIRYLLYKNQKIRDHKFSDYIVFFIYFIMMMGVAYAVTDHLEGFVRITLVISLYGLIFFVSNHNYKNAIVNIALIMMIPIFYISAMDAVYFVLTSPTTFLFQVVAVTTILWGMHRDYAFNWRRLISAVIGITITLALLPILSIEFNEDYSIIGDTAIDYVKEELGYDVDYVYAYNGFRGQDIQIMVSIIGDISKMKLLYRNGEIIKMITETSENETSDDVLLTYTGVVGEEDQFIEELAEHNGNDYIKENYKYVSLLIK